MILVLLGTNPYPFPRLLEAVDAYAVASGEMVIAQTGHTPVGTLRASAVRCQPFVDHAQIREWIQKADVIVTQGGFGSLRDCVKEGKLTIAVPRLTELGECQDAQTELVDALADLGLVVPVLDVAELPDAIRRARGVPLPPVPPSSVPALVAQRVREVLGG